MIASERNACGFAGISKSTLLGLLDDKLEPSTGIIDRNPHASFAVERTHQLRKLSSECLVHAGIGKSTLLGLIGGTLEPSTGMINRNPRTRFATFSQHHVDGLDLALNPLQYLCRCFAGTPEQELR